MYKPKFENKSKQNKKMQKKKYNTIKIKMDIKYNNYTMHKKLYNIFKFMCEPYQSYFIINRISINNELTAVQDQRGFSFSRASMMLYFY